MHCFAFPPRLLGALTSLGVVLAAACTGALASPQSQQPPATTSPPKTAAQTSPPQQDEAAKQAEREKKFAESMKNVRMKGSYTLTERPDDPPRSDTYEIESATKVEGDIWRFVARVKFGNIDVKLPMDIPVQWAGDTPVITLDKLSIPGLGTFSARVVFHDTKYAATWDAGPTHGGFMWGTLEKIEAEAK